MDSGLLDFRLALGLHERHGSENDGSMALHSNDTNDNHESDSMGGYRRGATDYSHISASEHYRASLLPSCPVLIDRNLERFRVHGTRLFRKEEKEMTERANESKDKFNPRLLIISLLLTMLVTTTVLSITGTFIGLTAQQACPSDSSQITPTICEQNYCLHSISGAVIPCNSTNCLSYGQRTSTFTTTSTTFVTVTTSLDVTNCSTTSIPSPAFACTATFNFRTNSLTGNAQFQIFNNNAGTSSTYQFDDTGQAVVSSDMLGSISWVDLTGQQFSTWLFQAKVSSALITLTILKADLICLGISGTVG